MKLEHKNIITEIKNDSETGYFFSGYASKFNGVDSYGDTVLKGAYADTLNNRDRTIQLRWNHTGPVIGKFSTIIEDSEGLYVEGELSKGHSVADDVAALLKHGAINGLSIGYVPLEFDEITKGQRHLKKIELYEISLVEEPADNNALVTDVKKAISNAESLKEIEKVLRDFGLSRKDSSALISRIYQLKSEVKKDNDLLSRLAAFHNQIKGNK